MIPLEQLWASVLGELDDAAEAAVEEHVLECGPCAERYATLLALGPAIAQLVAAGDVAIPLTRTLLDRLEAAGLVSRRYALAPGATVPCTATADDIYAVMRLEADFTGVSRVDLRGGLESVVDVPFDVHDGAALIATPSSIIRSLPTMRVDLRLVAVDGDRERVLGEYTLDHTAFEPPRS